MCGRPQNPAKGSASRTRQVKIYNHKRGLPVEQNTKRLLGGRAQPQLHALVPQGIADQFPPREILANGEDQGRLDGDFVHDLSRGTKTEGKNFANDQKEIRATRSTCVELAIRRNDADATPRAGSSVYRAVAAAPPANTVTRRPLAKISTRAPGKSDSKAMRKSSTSFTGTRLA